MFRLDKAFNIPFDTQQTLLPKNIQMDFNQQAIDIFPTKINSEYELNLMINNLKNG